MKFNNHGWGMKNMVIYCCILLLFLIIAVCNVQSLYKNMDVNQKGNKQNNNSTTTTNNNSNNNLGDSITQTDIVLNQKLIATYSEIIKSRSVAKEVIEKLGLNTFFFSDASSAIKTETFKELNGFDGKDFPTNEDMYIAYKLITNGYKIKYCADSEVVHSHKFTLKQQYKRYYDTGKFFKQNEYLNEYKVNKSGGKLAVYVLKRAWQEKNWKVLFDFIPNMTARFIGMKVGKM